MWPQAVNGNSWLNQYHVKQDTLWGVKWIYTDTGPRRKTHLQQPHVCICKYSAGRLCQVGKSLLSSKITKYSSWSHLPSSLPEVQAGQPRSQKAAKIVMETAKLFFKAWCQNWKAELLATANSFPSLLLHQAKSETWENGGQWWVQGSWQW